MKISSQFNEHVNDLIKFPNMSWPIVMASAAGWYVGRVIVETNTTMVQPYDRLSKYMTEEDALKFWEINFKKYYGVAKDELWFLEIADAKQKFRYN